MHFIILDFCKYDLLILIPLDFYKYALLIANVIFLWKPDDSVRKSITQTQSSRRNAMMTQARGGPQNSIFLYKCDKPFKIIILET